jgi:hypothetical protein
MITFQLFDGILDTLAFAHNDPFVDIKIMVGQPRDNFENFYDKADSMYRLLYHSIRDVIYIDELGYYHAEVWITKELSVNNIYTCIATAFCEIKYLKSLTARKIHNRTTTVLFNEKSVKLVTSWKKRDVEPMKKLLCEIIDSYETPDFDDIPYEIEATH